MERVKKMLDILKFSTKYTVRKMNDSDTDDIFDLCLQNTLFYKYCGKQPTKELIQSDLHITPPGVDASRKYYVGFYEGETLVAITDLIEGYPDENRCFIGFFMMNNSMQGKNLGSAIIQKLCAYLKDCGFTSVMLGIDKGNPQSMHFWNKNGFAAVREVKQDGGEIVVAEKML